MRVGAIVAVGTLLIFIACAYGVFIAAQYPA
jgi:hypothetical protein